MVLKNLVDFYHKKHKQLIYIPILILLFAILGIAISYFTTGEVIHKGVSLSGGIVATADVPLDIESVEQQLLAEFPDAEFTVSILQNGGEQAGVIVETNIQDRRAFETVFSQITGVPPDEMTIEQTDSAFGADFFSSLIRGVIVAFILMGAVVYFTFRKWTPALTVVLCVFADLVVTLGVVSLLGIKLSSAGIAAFLMMIGYSVDTNILLSWRMVKQIKEPIDVRIAGAAKTGLLMTATTMGALIVGIIFTNSPVIAQILSILLIGLVADVINTWLLNASILRRVVE